MTKGEAIKYLQQLYPNGGHCWLDGQRIEAISMAINALKEEPTSDDLGNYINELSKQFPEVSFAKLSRIAVRVANWQKEKMAANTTDAMIGLPYENKDGGYTHLIDVSRPLPVGNNKIAIIFKED